MRISPLRRIALAGVAATLLLGACSKSSSDTTAAIAAETTAAAAPAAAADPNFPTKGSGEVQLYNWTDYIDPKVLETFTKDTGIKVVLSTYDSNETLLAKLQAGGTGYDVIVPSDYMVKQMIELGLLQEVKPSTFPNGKNIKPNFLDVYFDNGRNYTAPYMYGTTGISVDTAKVPTPPKSWAEFFTPPAEAAGKLGILDRFDGFLFVMPAVYYLLVHLQPWVTK